MRVGRNDPCPCGSGKKYKSCHALVEQRRPPPAPVDDLTRRRLYEAFAAYQRGQLSEAETISRAILNKAPSQPDAHHILGLIAMQQGHLGDALGLIDHAISLGENDSMHSNRGIVLQALGRHEDALQAFNASIALRPASAPLLCNLGASLLKLGRFDEAEPALRAAVAADPRFAEAHSGLGALMWARGRPSVALEHYNDSLSIESRQPEIWDRVGVILNAVNRTDEAREAFTRAYQLDPSPVRRLRKTLLISHVFESLDDMWAQRRRFEAGLDELIEAGGLVESSSGHLFCAALFNLAYQGDNVLPVLRKAAAMYSALCPSLQFRALHVDRPRDAARPVRLGFYSAYVHDHPVAHCYAGLVKALAEDPGFEVLLISDQALPQGGGRKPYEGFAGRFVRVSGSHEDVRRQIAGLELDVLAYQDIGMDDISYFMGFARLARTQIAMGGHPVTTGLPEMDIVLSSSLGEPPDAQAHYSERLVALDPGLAKFERPTLPERFKDRGALGLPEQGNLYVCPMMLHKIHPDFDVAVAEILRRDPHGHAIFFEHPNAGWERDLRARLVHRLGDRLSERLHFLPFLRDREDFAAVNYHASVVLDPFHFGIGSTVCTTVAVGTPVVTWPSGFLRGRVGLAFATLLEVPECIAVDAEDFVSRALRIAGDEALRAELHRRILAHGDRLFEGSLFPEAGQAFFHSLLPALLDEPLRPSSND